MTPIEQSQAFRMTGRTLTLPIEFRIKAHRYVRVGIFNDIVTMIKVLLEACIKVIIKNNVV